ncbi:hypothetical protein [Acinetobacter junii]|uniref:hypothetical protein n=1 Tax=Acinetobacter junii TaxID=40215 RepID=UPI001FB3332A|nr:hypothetical protein [Acinetobacter junii]UOB52336.1 hypothetical protein MRY16_14730 [Acinetobacter junii]
MVALVLFLSTTVFFPITILVFLLPIIFVREFFLHKNNIVFQKREIYAYVLMFLVAVIVNYLNIFNGAVIPNVQEGSVLGNIPYVLLLPFAFLIGKFIYLKDLKWLQYFIIVEIIVGCFEYYYGVPTFFVNNTSVTELSDTDILYQKRVFGFSANSSNLAAKVVYLTVLTMMQIKLNKKITRELIFFMFFILLGLVVTFNRTAIISIFVSAFILFGMSLRGLVLLSIPIVGGLFYNRDSIYEQLTRGRGTVDLSGRDQIFSYFYHFWNENLLLGNMGTKLWWNNAGSIWHAHNSYLEFLSSNGLLPTLLFLISFLMLFSRGLSIVLPILIFSLSQYGFLWGLSFYDIVFSAIIYNYVKLNFKEAKL